MAGVSVLSLAQGHDLPRKPAYPPLTASYRVPQTPARPPSTDHGETDAERQTDEAGHGQKLPLLLRPSAPGPAHQAEPRHPASGVSATAPNGGCPADESDGDKARCPADDPPVRSPAP